MADSRFGPYIRWIKSETDSENRSLKKEDDVFTVDLKRALEIFQCLNFLESQKLKDFGKIKEFNEKIQILNGRYGVYIKCGKTNVSLPKDTNLDSFSIEDATVLLEEKLKDKSTEFKKNKTRNKKIVYKKKT